MAYILFTKRPNATQSYNNFRIASMIADRAGTSQEKAENLLAKMYYKSISTAAVEEKVVPILPPAGNNLWTWNKSFEIACDIAAQWADAEIPILVPSDANIVMGNDLSELEIDDMKLVLDDLDFGFDENDETIISIARTTDETKELALIQQAQELEQEEKDIKAIIDNVELTFAKYLSQKIKEAGLNPARLARRANMLTATITRLSKGIIVVPTKSQILAIGIALELDKQEFDYMLGLAGYTLSGHVPRDCVVAYYLSKEIYDLGRINKTLFLNDMPTLGTHIVMPR